MSDVHSVLMLNVLQTIRRRKTIGRTIKSLRPSNRTNLTGLLPRVVDDLSPSPMPAGELPPPLTDSHDDDDDDDVFSKDFPIFGQPDTVCIDVSGRGYVNQSRIHVTSTLCRSLPRLLAVAAVDDDSDVAAEHRTLSSWRRSICDVSKPKSRRPLMVFGAVDVDRSSLFRGLATKKSTSSRRSLVTAGGKMTSTPQICTGRHGKVSTRSKRGAGCEEGRRPRADSRSSSWRQSLMSLLKGVVRTKSSVDLWATTTTTTTTQHHQGAVATGAPRSQSNFRRANSLPRSLKAMKRQSSSDAAHVKSKSKSVEDQLDSTDRSSRSSFRSQMTTPAGERLGRSLSLPRSHQVRGAKSRVGLRPQSMEVHIVALDEFGRPSSAAGPCSGTVTERRVHVSIPEQPWTKPFANVRLRQRSARAIESDKYQSSSGKLLLYYAN